MLFMGQDTRGSQMSIFCFGLSHRTAAVDVRERFAIPVSALPEALAQLKTIPGVTGRHCLDLQSHRVLCDWRARGHLSARFLRELLSRFPSGGRKASVSFMRR